MKKVVIDQVEVVADNNVLQVRFRKLSSDGDFLGYHRTSIEPGGSVDAQMAAVNVHLAQMGFDGVPEWGIVKDHASVAHTPEKVAAFRAAAEERAARRP